MNEISKYMCEQIPIDHCPRCGVKGVSIKVKSSIEVKPTIKVNCRNLSGQNDSELFGQCGVCKKGVILHLPVTGTPILAITMVKDDIPEHLPKNIYKFIKQGTDSLCQKNFDAAGSMFRKTLETALKHKFSENAGAPLFEQIRKAANNGRLTSDMADWADQIRILGNSAVHADEPIAEEDASEMGEFTKLVMIYLFTLPEKLRIAKADGH